MTSRREAENVVRKIRKSRRANDPGGAAADANARSLSRALDMYARRISILSHSISLTPGTGSLLNYTPNRRTSSWN